MSAEIARSSRVFVYCQSICQGQVKSHYCVVYVQYWAHAHSHTSAILRHRTHNDAVCLFVCLCTRISASICRTAIQILLHCTTENINISYFLTVNIWGVYDKKSAKVWLFVWGSFKHFHYAAMLSPKTGGLQSTSNTSLYQTIGVPSQWLSWYNSIYTSMFWISHIHRGDKFVNISTDKYD